MAEAEHQTETTLISGLRFNRWPSQPPGKSAPQGGKVSAELVRYVMKHHPDFTFQAALIYKRAEALRLRPTPPHPPTDGWGTRN